RYESDSSTTLLFFLIQEGLLIGYSFCLAALLVFGTISYFISDWTIVGCFSVAIVAGASLYISVLRYNTKLMGTIERRATLGYSVFTKLAIPLVLVTARFHSLSSVQIVAHGNWLRRLHLLLHLDVRYVDVDCCHRGNHVSSLR
ncbi:hypothetical protein PMAYCL1PPCAC_17653, partial [Pristionchus mayeri]